MYLLLCVKSVEIVEVVGGLAASIKVNKTPKGIMRSAVPLPCLFDVVKSQNVAGQRPRQGTKSCRMGRNSVRPSAPLWLALRPCWLALRPLQPALRPLQQALRPLQQAFRPLQQAFRPL